VEVVQAYRLVSAPVVAKLQDVYENFKRSEKNGGTFPRFVESLELLQARIVFRIVSVWDEQQARCRNLGGWAAARNVTHRGVVYHPHGQLRFRS
jgi:hypothetical protein